jgi:hypothetical protein
MIMMIMTLNCGGDVDDELLLSRVLLRCYGVLMGGYF